MATIHPSDGGIDFRLGGMTIAANPENVAETSFCTRLGPISTVEHIMAAFAGLGITDAVVELSAPELPALDGGSREFCNCLESGGSNVLGERTLIGPFARIFVHDESAKIAISTGTGHWRYAFSSEDRYPYDQTYETEDIGQAFCDEIAPARTFGWEKDLPMIESQGLAQGLTHANALLLGEDGPVTEPFYPDEPARHKLLDAIGDLYLAGIPITLLNFVGERSGHKLNVEAARRLKAAVQIED